MNILKFSSIVWVLTFFLLGCTQGTNEGSGDTNTTQNISDTQDIAPVEEVSNTPSVSSNNTSSDTSTVTPEPVDETIHKREETQVLEEEEEDTITEETIPSNWYVRLIAEDVTRHLKTTITQLGALETAIEANKQTVLSGGRFAGPYLDIVFMNPIGSPAGSYKTDYHEYAENVDDEWEFVVQTDDANAEISLSWNGLYALTPYLDDTNRLQYKEYRSLSNPLVEKMKLIDMDTGIEIPLKINGEVQIYTFNMNGSNEHTLKWILRYE